MVQLHHYTIISFVLLMMTGVALFLPYVHAALISYLPVIYYVHIVLGLIFGVTLLIPLLTQWPVGKVIRRFDWFFPLVFGTVIVVTGFFIWQVTLFPTTWRGLAFHWHGWMSYALSAWLLVHAVYKAIGYRPANDGLNARVDPTRRRFLQWFGTGIVGAAVFTIVDPVGWLTRSFNASNGEEGTSDTATDFAAYYTVTGGYPVTDLSTYRLKIDGLVAHPMTLKWSDLIALAPLQEQADFHCVTGWSVPNVQWKGVHLKSLIHLVKPSPQASYVHFYSFDGVYTESLSLSEALHPTVMLAYQLNGKPLSTKQGFPLRLVVPTMYGYKSIKWVNRVEFSDKPLVGYWEARGYSTEAYLGKGM
jgi:DMSO/TMAO reductase YedYZ molybdopterin-dependent catalytic subunit